MIWPRIVLGVALVATAIWAGAAGRSLWMIPLLGAVFSVAMIDGKNAAWKKAFFASSAGDRAKTLAGTLVVEVILVAILFFVASGIASALGAAPPRQPLASLDVAVAGGALAGALIIMAVVRRVEGDRDPVTRAMENLDAEIRRASRRGGDPDEEEDGIEESPLDDLIDEADMMAERKIVTPQEISGLARHFAEHPDVEASISALTALSVGRPRDPRIGAAHERRVGLTGLRLFADQMEETHDDAEGARLRAALDAAGLDQVVLRGLAEEAAEWVRHDAAWLAETLNTRLDFRDDVVAAALTAILQDLETRRAPTPGTAEAALRTRAAAALARLEAL